MSLLDKLFAGDLVERIDSLEDRVGILEGMVGNAELRDKAKILHMLRSPLTTVEVATELKKSRTWASRLLNKLEKEGRVVESGKKQGQDLYVRKDAN